MFKGFGNAESSVVKLRLGNESTQRLNDIDAGGPRFACTVLVISLLQRSASLIWQPLEPQG